MRVSRAKILFLVALVAVFLASLPASFGEKQTGLLKVEDSGPVKTARGFTTINSDNTYYPGDFFSITVTAKSDGHHGVTEEGEIKEYQQLEEPDLENVWYSSTEEKIKTPMLDEYFESESAAVEEAENLIEGVNKFADKPYTDNPHATEKSEGWFPQWDEHTWKVQTLKVKACG